MKQVFFLLVLPLFLFSQINKEVSAPSILLKSGVYDGKIALRWAVDEPIAWQKANKIGFVLTRYTLAKNGNLLQTPEEKNLGTFLPKPPKEWKDLIEKNDNAAIVAQSLYGESFEVEMGKEKDKLQAIVNKSQELDQRFAFALMAADLDFEVAKLAGWGFIDTEVKPNEKYLYTVSLNENTKPKITVEKGTALASLSEKTELPKPLDFIGIFQDKIVTLSWEYRQLRDIYTAYFIEKSENGKDFTPISNLPVMNMNDNDSSQAQGMVYVDSLKQNNTSYSYRIRGKSIFGDYGPYSEIVAGAGKKSLEASPRITSFNLTPTETIKINWEFPKEAEKDIVAFQLMHSENDEEKSYRLVEDKIAVSKRSTETKSLSAANYFKIIAIGKNNDQKASFSVLVQPNDSTPPAIPIAFKGKIDSTGVARLEWQANTEKDLEGYHVFRGIQKDEEMVRLTPQAITKNTFEDKVVLENLNSKVYYYVVATDKRKNQSNF